MVLGGIGPSDAVRHVSVEEVSAVVFGWKDIIIGS